MTDDEILGAIMRPATVRKGFVRRRLAIHPWIRGSASCDVCGRLRTSAYAHPDPLRPGVVLYRCLYHCFLASVRDNPKAAPGGGIYK